MSYLLNSYLGVNPVFVSSSHLYVCRCSPHLRSLPHLTLPRQFCQAQDHHVMINTNITTTTVISTKIVFPKDYLKKNISTPKRTKNILEDPLIEDMKIRHFEALPISTTETNHHNHGHQHQNFLRSNTTKLNQDESSFNIKKTNHFNQYQYS